MVSIVCLLGFVCIILCSAVGAANFCSIRNLEADLHESWFKGIFSTHSELLLWESFRLECFNKRIQFGG